VTYDIPSTIRLRHLNLQRVAPQLTQLTLFHTSFQYSVAAAIERNADSIIAIMLDLSVSSFAFRSYREEQIKPNAF
jgi:16S rRNA C1402 N4-methylase RsmH